MHVADSGLLERLLAAQRRLAGDVLLEVGIQPLECIVMLPLYIIDEGTLLANSELAVCSRR